MITKLVFESVVCGTVIASLQGWKPKGFYQLFRVYTVIKMVNYCIIFAITLVIGICGVIAPILIYSLTGREIPLDYGLVIDAGSSHTQFYLYKWNGDKYRNTGSVEEIDTCRMNSPLSKTDPELAGSMLSPCLTNVTRNLPSEKRFSTQIFLGATAGFRILNASEPYLSEAILISLQCALKSSGLSYKQAKIITGEEEGLYAWITTNFLIKSLETEGETTSAALDLGGASTQIAFALNQSNSVVETNDNATTELTLYGRNFRVESISYLCYGIHEIRNRHLALIADNLDPANPLEDPCSPKGYQFKVDAQTLFGQSCTRNDRYDEYLFRNRHAKDPIEFTFNGTSNSTACNFLVKQLIDPISCQAQNFSNCFNRPTDVPTTEKQFYAFSTFFFVTDFLNATNVTLAKYRNLTDEFCNKEWNLIEGDEAGDTIASIICFEAHYIDLLLTDKGYGFNETTWSNLLFVKKINKAEAGWSMGYMINTTNCIATEKPTEPEINLTVTIILAVIGLAILGVSVFFFRKHRIERSSSPSYLEV